jgi:peptidoglycan-associated lipoprotein
MTVQQTTRLSFAALALLLASACTTPTTGGGASDAQRDARRDEGQPTCCAGPQPKRPVFAPSASTVYFGFDQFTVDAEGAKVIEANQRFMRDKAEVTLRLEGNTDERGGREYNLALGQKRAEAVLRQLALQGVSVQRIETVSFGEERPAASGDSADARAKNRRVDFVYAN